MQFALWHTKSILVCLIPFIGCGTWIFLRGWYKKSANSIELHNVEEDHVKSAIEVDEVSKDEIRLVDESWEEIPVESDEVEVVKSVSEKVDLIDSANLNKQTFISEEIFEEEVPLPVTNMSSGILLFGTNNNLGIIQNGKIGAKCKLSGEEVLEQCSFAKINPNKTKGWIDYEVLKKTGFSAYLDTNFFANPKNLYKVRLTDGFIKKWINNKTQHLEVYQLFTDPTKNKNNPYSKIVKPGDKLLLTIKPSFAYQATKKFYGESRFYVGQLKELLPKVAGGSKKAITKLDVTNKWFNCKLPGDDKAAKKCFIYEFEGENKNKKALNTTKLKKHPNKASVVEKDNYYIIKFLDPQTLQDGAYAATDTINMDVYSNQDRTAQDEGEVNTIQFKNLAHVIMHHEAWDEGIAIIL